jgi:hypothetical protein
LKKCTRKLNVEKYQSLGLELHMQVACVARLVLADHNWVQKQQTGHFLYILKRSPATMYIRTSRMVSGQTAGLPQEEASAKKIRQRWQELHTIQHLFIVSLCLDAVNATIHSASTQRANEKIS